MNRNGVGLGLYITKMIVQQFDGTVTVDSTFGKGSTFGMTLVLSKNVQEKLKIQREFNTRVERRPIIKIVIKKHEIDLDRTIKESDLISEDLSQIQSEREINFYLMKKMDSSMKKFLDYPTQEEKC